MTESIEGKQNAIPRFGQGEHLLHQYDIEIESVVKGRGSLIVRTKKESFMLNEFTGSKEKIGEIAKVLEELQQWDPINERILPTKEGELWVRDEEGPVYILKTYTAGRECDVKNTFEVLEGVRKLADLHLALQELPVERPEVFLLTEHELGTEIMRHNRELRNVKNYIRKKKKGNEFEELYEKAYGYFYEQANQIEEYEKSLCLREEASKLQLCHGDYHHHNVYDCGQRSHIRHYERMRMDHPMSDLAKYMRKVLEKNKWNAKLGMSMLEMYERLIPLSREEKMQLYVRLAYPEKFWKIANHYNNSKKAWASKRDGEKLRHLLGVEQSRQEFLEILYNRGK